MRILSVAWRTRGLDEFLLGLAFLMLGGFSVPLNGAGRLLAPVSIAQWISIAGSVFTVAGVVLLFAFTAHVFYRSRPWAPFVVGTVLAIGLYYIVGHGMDRLSVETVEEAVVVQLRWAAFSVVGALLAFAWAGGAAYLHLRQLRKRLALGLADPVVVNRMALWSLFGAISVGMTATAGILIMLGGTARELIQPLVTATGGLADSVVLLLAFSPPRAYVESVRRRAAAGATA